MNVPGRGAAVVVAVALSPFAIAAGVLGAMLVQDTAAPAPLVPAAEVPVPPPDREMRSDSESISSETAVPSTTPTTAARAPRFVAPATPLARATPAPAPAPSTSAPRAEPTAEPTAVPITTPPKPAAPTWTQANQNAADAKCAEKFGPGSTAKNTPAIGEEYDPAVGYPCTAP